ncbi:2-isopropylmalate synthase [Yokenella regensburgei]|nr:2-isopropylmalate synthase [Yokenella regensburgei]
MAIKVRKDIMNLHTRINHHEIWRTSQTVSQICNMPVPGEQSDCWHRCLRNTPPGSTRTA